MLFFLLKKQKQKTKSLRTSVSTGRTRTFALLKTQCFYISFFIWAFLFLQRLTSHVECFSNSLRQMMQVTLVFPTDIHVTENANVADVEGFLRKVWTWWYVQLNSLQYLQLHRLYECTCTYMMLGRQGGWKPKLIHPIFLELFLNGKRSSFC